MKAGNPSQNSDKGRTDDVAAEKSGIGSRDTYRKAEYIAGHKDMISAEDFANWDDGKLSTNKLYNQIKKQHTFTLEKCVPGLPYAVEI